VGKGVVWLAATRPTARGKPGPTLIPLSGAPQTRRNASSRQALRRTSALTEQGPRTGRAEQNAVPEDGAVRQTVYQHRTRVP
jgi:hypothetical protein